MTRLLVVGAGGHGKVAADTAVASGYSDVAFLDKAWPQLSSNGPWKVIGSSTSSFDDPIFCAIGKNDQRAKMFQEFELDASPVLLHPSVILSPSAIIGAGTMAVAGSIVNAESLIGRGVILNTACSVDHDCEIGDFVHLSPGVRLAGGVKIEEGAWVGIGAVVREGIRIGKWATIAAGAVVVNDVEDEERVGGVPAKPLNRGS